MSNTKLVVIMNLSSILYGIRKVESNNSVNLLLELNDNYSLIIEGGFSIRKRNTEIVSSSEYIESDFSHELLITIKYLLENKKIENAHFDEDSGKLILELEFGLYFESFFGEDDYESWELSKNGISIYGSECGTIIHY